MTIRSGTLISYIKKTKKCKSCNVHKFTKIWIYEKYFWPWIILFSCFYQRVDLALITLTHFYHSYHKFKILYGKKCHMHIMTCYELLLINIWHLFDKLQLSIFMFWTWIYELGRNLCKQCCWKSITKNTSKIKCETVY